MAFSDTLKELLDQGLQVSKEIASRAGEKAQDWGSKGLEASRDFAAKAGARVQELGEKGVLILEIKQLESQARKLIGGLGAEVCAAFEQGAASVQAEDPPVKELMAKIRAVKNSIDEREAEIAAKK
jgi:capsule polysaccharide export protein KpsE/RkpR